MSWDRKWDTEVSQLPWELPWQDWHKYILETEQGSTILLTFQAFSLEAQLLGSCDHDYVKVIDYDDNTELAIGSVVRDS